MRLYTKILISMLIGVVFGLFANLFDIGWLREVLVALEPLGIAFIRLITMIVVPLVVASLILGTASLGDIGKLGRIGAKTLAFFLASTIVASTIGLLLGLLLRPGGRLDSATRDGLVGQFQADVTTRVAAAESVTPSIGQTLVQMIPQNPIAAAAQMDLLPLIIFTLIFGAAISLIQAERRRVVLTFFEGINEASMLVIGWVMRLAPYAVFALIASVVARFGMDLLQSLLIFSLVVVVGLLLHVLVTFSAAVQFLARLNPLYFFRRIAQAPLVAFSTSSSSATLPVAMETAEEELGISKEVSSFVLPLGATVNMNGSALYKAVAVVFIAQVYGFPLGLPEYVTIVLTSTVSAVAGAGVPGSGMVTILIVLNAVGMGPYAAAGVALVIGVDRILDMLRTAVNVTGDLVTAALIARSEGENLIARSQPQPLQVAEVPTEVPAEVPVALVARDQP